MKLNPNDAHLLARLVDAEAADQPVLGRIAVAAVVLNRVALPGYGGPTLRGVVDGFEIADRIDAITEPQESTVHAVGVACAGYDPTEGAVVFWRWREMPPLDVAQDGLAVCLVGGYVFAVARSASR